MVQLRKSDLVLKTRRKFVAASAAAVGAFAIVPGRAKAAQFEFRCSSALAVDHPSSVRLSQMWAAIEQESGGRLHTQFFPASQLGGDSAMLAQLRLGALQFNFLYPGYLSTVVPSADITNLSLVFSDADEGLRVMNGPVGSYVRDETASKGMYALRTFWDSGMFQVGSNTHPIRNPEDLQGFKLRSADSKITVDFWKMLGAIPVALSLNEVYTALQTRLIDGENATLIVIETSKFYEVNKYASITNHTWTGNWLIANAEAWKSLPPDLQVIVERNNTKYAELCHADIKALTNTLVDKLTQQGVAVNRVNQAPFRPRLRPYFDDWSKTFGPTLWGALQTALGRKLT